MTDEKPSRVLIGYKGVKYGLQKSRERPVAKPDAFGGDSSDEETVDAQITKQQQKNATAHKIAAAQAAALAEDNTVYEYDSLYDDMQRSRESAKRKELEERKPKYIQALMQKAEIRKKEQDIAYERRLLKERKKDDHLYEEKEAFLTSAYKKKLMEDKHWIEREKRMDAVEAAEDVTKKSDLSGFYKNLCTRNVAFASNRFSEATHKQSESPNVDEEGPEAHQEEPSVAKEDTAADEGGVEEESGEKESAIRPELVPDVVKHAMKIGDGTEEAVKDRRKRRNDESTIASARERYLARKRQAQGDGS